MNTNTYSFFDDIICISLANRTDRRSHAQDIFKKLDIPARFMLVEKHPQGGMYGCFQSHIQAIQKAYVSGKNTLLVFEDDLLPTDSYKEKHILHAIEFLEFIPDWDVFYFGYFVFNYNLNPRNSYLSADVVYPHIVKYCPFGAHAYCLSRKGMQVILDKYISYIGKVHYDIFLVEHCNLTSYCYTPMLFDQRLCFKSDIEAQNVFECVARNMQCMVDKTKALWRISVVKDHVDRHLFFYLFITLLVTTMVFVMCVMSNKHL